jgi:hypothetical protein
MSGSKSKVHPEEANNLKQAVVNQKFTKGESRKGRQSQASIEFEC